ncbi:PLC-like phosphodiesterase [Pluteus cervinus]|uniref:PLC-like phosphodiesterase n=1 Tax=Pluteus cervinus TaxID=181527 RepID=A0ACD3AG93_9AGAR|nr:PLC-like phosphodiesterase [Pluteus cervinus]
MTPPTVTRWMQTHRHLFGDRPLYELCIPASHDAGTYRREFGTSHGTESNVLTQTKSIFDQLELGVRRLDIRPTRATPDSELIARWNCGHYTGEAADKIGWQGGSCVPMQEFVDDLNRFTKDNAELVIVDISHVYNIVIKNPRSSIEVGVQEGVWQMLLAILDGIDNRFTLQRAEQAGGARGKQLQDYKLNQFIGSNQAAVVVVVDGYGNHDELFRHGFWPSRYLQLNEHSVMHTQSPFEAILSTLTPFGPNLNANSVLNLAREEQQRRFPWLLQALAAYGYPAQIPIDRIQSDDLFNFCLATSYQRFNVANGLLQNKVIVYGGALVTDPGVHNNIQNAINNRQTYQVNNDSMGGDPWYGVPKSCAIYYQQDGLIKGRWAKENQSLHFEQDVISITYGGAQIRNQIVYLNVLKCIAERQRFRVSNENLGGDPLPNIHKECEIHFKEWGGEERREKGSEGKDIDFETTWEKFGKAAMSASQHGPF